MRGVGRKTSVPAADDPFALDQLPQNRQRRTGTAVRLPRDPSPGRSGSVSKSEALPPRTRNETPAEAPKRPELESKGQQPSFFPSLSESFWNEDDLSDNPRLTLRLSTVTVRLDEPLDELMPDSAKPGLANKLRQKIATARFGHDDKAAQAARGVLDALKAGRAADLPALVTALDSMKAPGQFILGYLGKCKSAAELEQIHAQLARRPEQAPEVERVLKKIQNTVAQSLANISPALSPSLQATLAAAIKQGRMEDYDDALGQATRAAPQLEIGHEASYIVVLDAIGYLLQKHIVQLSEVQHFFAEVITGAQLLQTVEHVHDRGMQEQVLALTSAQHCLNARRMDAQATYLRKASELNSGDPDFAMSLVSLSEDFGTLQSYGGAHETTELGALRGKLQHLHDAAVLDALDEKTLRALGRAVYALKVPEFAGAIDGAFARKTAPREAAHAEITLNVILALQKFGTPEGPSPAALLRLIKDARTAHARSTFARKKPFEAELTARVLESRMTPEDRRALGDAMRTRGMQELIAALDLVSSTAAVKEYEGLPAELHELASALTAVREASGIRGPLAPSKGLEAISDGTRDALRACDIDIGRNNSVHVLAGIALPAVQAAVNSAMDRSIDKLRKDAGNNPDLLDQYDVLQDYVIDGRPLIDQADLNKPGGDVQEVFAAAKQTLLDLCGNDARMLAELRTVASTQAMDAFKAAVLQPAHNPFRRSDGTPFEPGSLGVATMSIRRDGQGGLLVTYQWRFPQSAFGRVTDAQGVEGKIALDSPVRTGFSCTVAIAADGKTSQARPVDFWQAGKPPESVDELTKANANPYLVDELLEFTKTEFSTENILFLRALNDFDKLTGQDAIMASAQALADEYITQTAPRQINVDAPKRAGVEAAIREAARNPNDAAAMQKMLDAFGLARHEVGNLLRKDTFPRFVKQASASRDLAKTKALPDAVLAAPEAQRAALPVPQKEWERINADWPSYNSSLYINIRGLVGLFAAAKDVQHLVDELGSKDKLLVTPYEEIKRQIFRQHALECFAKFSPLDISSLLYNLENTPSLKGDWHKDVLREAARASLVGTREGQMTAEGVLLRFARHMVSYELLAEWFDKGHVKEPEVASFFSQMENSELGDVVSRAVLAEGLQRIALDVVEMRKVPVEQLGKRLQERAEKWAAELDSGQPIGPIGELVTTANSLATQFDMHKKACADLGLRDTEAYDTVRQRASSLASTLLAHVRTRSLTPDQVTALKAILVTLGGNREAINSALAEPDQPLPPPPDDDAPPPPPDDPPA